MVLGTLKVLLITCWFPLVMITDKNFLLRLGQSTVFSVSFGWSFGHTCFGLYWWCIVSFLTNVGITESIPISFGEVIYDVRLSYIEYFSRDMFMPVL